MLWLKTFLKGRLVSNSILVMFWQAARLSLLAIWTLLAARMLGAENYGLFAGLGGLAATFAGFVGLGTGLLMYQRVSVNQQLFSQQWRQARTVNIISGIALSLLFVIIANHNHASPILYIAILALSEIVLYPCITAAAFAFSSHDRMGWAAALPAINAGLRLAAALLLALESSSQSFKSYLWLHLAASAISACIAMCAVHYVLRPVASDFRYTKADAIEGLSFATGWATSTSMTTLDKSIVLRNAGENIAGIYASSYRIASIFTMPIDAMVMSAMPRLFRHGAGHTTQARLVGIMCGISVIYGVALGLILWTFAKPFASLLGPEYAEVASSLRLLAVWPCLYGLRQVSCNVLVGNGYRKTRAALEGSALILMIFLAELLLPQYAIQGAALMLLASEAFIVIVSWGVLAATIANPFTLKNE